MRSCLTPQHCRRPKNKPWIEYQIVDHAYCDGVISISMASFIDTSHFFGWKVSLDETADDALSAGIVLQSAVHFGLLSALFLRGWMALEKSLLLRNSLTSYEDGQPVEAMSLVCVCYALSTHYRSCIWITLTQQIKLWGQSSEMHRFQTWVQYGWNNLFPTLSHTENTSHHVFACRKCISTQIVRFFCLCHQMCFTSADSRYTFTKSPKQTCTCSWIAFLFCRQGSSQPLWNGVQGLFQSLWMSID